MKWLGLTGGVGAVVEMVQGSPDCIPTVMPPTAPSPVKRSLMQLII